MSEERLIRLPQVESLTGLRRAHIYGLARRGLFPKPIKIGARASAWTRNPAFQLGAGKNPARIRSGPRALRPNRTQPQERVRRP